MNTSLLNQFLAFLTLLGAFISLLIIHSCKEPPDPEFSGTVSGTVVDASETTKKLQGVLVELLQGTEVVTSTQTSSSGSFSLTVSNLKGAERYSVRASLEGYEEYIAEQFEMNAGDNTEQVSINLVPKPKIRGTIRHKVTQAPLSNVSVAMSPSDKTITTNEFGEYLFEKLEAGAYRIIASRSSFETQTINVQLASGEDKVQDINLTPLAPVLTVDKQTLDFGSTETTLPITLTNTGGDTIRWNVIESISWANANPLTGMVTTEPVTLNINVDRTGVIPESYNQTMTIASNAGTFTITITMNVQGALLQIAPAEINFGTTDSEISLQLTRVGSGTLNYEIQSDKSWLTVSPINGSVSNEIDFITVKANRLSLGIGNHSARLAFNTDNGSQIVNVAITIPDPTAPQLSIEPLSLNFGTDDATKILSLSNTGKGAVQWTATKAANWMVVSSSTGTLAEGATQDLTITINRTSLSPNKYSDVLRFTSNGGNVNVPVDMEVANKPVLRVNPEVLTFKRGVDKLTFDIQNIGNGSMDWQITTNNSWMTLNPISGTNNGTVNVTVSRSGLSFGNYSGQVDITSDGGNSLVKVELQHPAPNDAPVASFTSTRTTANLGETVEFDASGSTDAQDATNTLEVRWRFDVGLAYTNWTTYKLASHSYSNVGVKTVTLDVRDTEGEVTSTSKNINVVQNQAPVASFTVSPTTGERLDTQFNVNASGSTDDIDALATLQVRWQWDAGEAFTDWTLTKTASRSYTTEGTKTITLEVKDSYGLTSTDTRNVEVISNNDTDGDGVKDNADADFDGDGLMEIWTINDLYAIRNDLTGTGAGRQGAPVGGFKGFELMNDLDFNNNDHYSDVSLKASVASGSGWPGIGASGSRFNTTLEGNGYTIFNFYINSTTTNRGLFFDTGASSKIRNLHIVARYLSGGNYSGGLAGSHQGEATNCSVTGTMVGGDYSGLLIGRLYSNGRVIGCYTDGSIEGKSSIGGLIGQIYDTGAASEVRYSYSTTLVKGTGSVGGLIGGASYVRTIISYCYAKGNVSTSADYAGGLMGYFDGYAERLVSACYATGNVLTTYTGSYPYIGGLIGSASGGTVNTSYSTGSVTAETTNTAYKGGLIGTGGSGVTINNYWNTVTSGMTTSNGGTGQTTAELQGPTSATGIYVSWSEEEWDFGTSVQYPVLKGMPGGVGKQRE